MARTWKHILRHDHFRAKYRYVGVFFERRFQPLSVGGFFSNQRESISRCPKSPFPSKSQNRQIARTSPLRGAWRDRDPNDIFAHCSLIFHFLDFKFPKFVCPSELYPFIGFFLEINRKKKNIWKTTQNVSAPGIFIILSIVLKLGTPVLHTQAQNNCYRIYNFAQEVKIWTKNLRKGCFTYPFGFEKVLALFDPSWSTHVLSGLEAQSQSWWSYRNHSAAAIMLRFRLWKRALTTTHSCYFKS